jgi:MFS family permease
MGFLLALLACASPISTFLEARAASAGVEEASRVVSLLSLVMGIAFLVGAAYVVVAISAQTQLQEELPEDVRGRVFGVLNMLVSIASLAPIIIVAPVADLVGREPVILVVGVIVTLWGIGSAVSRVSSPIEEGARVPSGPTGAVDPMTVATSPTDLGVPAVVAEEPAVVPRRVKSTRRRSAQPVEDGETP